MAVRPIDANALARRIREYMDDFLNATTRLATCRAILSMLGDENQTPTLRPVSREQVEKVWKGEWIIQQDEHREFTKKCPKCGFPISGWWGADKFCANCGAPMTDEAVDMVMERLEAVRNES